MCGSFEKFHVVVVALLQEGADLIGLPRAVFVDEKLRIWFANTLLCGGDLKSTVLESLKLRRGRKVIVVE
ncbi:MAG TPA: hypothetical protein VKM56_07690, partial [Verrucomicrobiae bacterium]|nr:hypothetical protein [Verrucomicrobiae bacterium]